MSLHKAFLAGFVRRWHTNPDLAHTCDRIDGHAGRVARIILMLHPDPSVALLRAALIHDDGESVIGDMSATAKAAHSDITSMILSIEDQAIGQVWGAAHQISQIDRQWLKFADRLDAYMWARHHAPHVMGADGWPAARNWLEAESILLGCTDGFHDAAEAA